MAEDTKAKKGRKRPSTYKTRNWVTVIYPESGKPGWRDILRSWCVQAFVSPIHDRDTNQDGDKTPKKPHYHVMVMWDGPKRAENVEKLFGELGGVGCAPCNSARGYARYLCHLDNPEKAQYDLRDVEAFGGADYLEVIQLETDRRATIGEMMDWCRAEGCISFAALCDEARANHPVWWQALCAHSTMIMYRYLRALEYQLQSEARQVPAPPPPEAPPREVDPVAVAKAEVANAETALLAARERLAAMERKEAPLYDGPVDGRAIIL